LNRFEAARHVLDGTAREPQREQGCAFAPSNIALCKYWGKRNEELNLPVTSSLSISLGDLGAHTTVKPAEKDRLILNGRELAANDKISERAFAFIDLFRTGTALRLEIDSTINIPVAAGVASSAAGFAALTLALDDLFGWNLAPRQLSILARMGSGSAARSITPGFMLWHAGNDEQGMDSYAEPIQETWPTLRIGLVLLCEGEKAIGSREAMKRTRGTSALYQAWPRKVYEDITAVRHAIETRDIDILGRTAESNALAMHATMLDSWPPVLYWQAETIEVLRKVWALREEDLSLYITMDAGPNVKLLFTEADASAVSEAFPNIQIVTPFANGDPD
jgi:diphosphomevalonate decarboxylase